MIAISRPLPVASVVVVYGVCWVPALTLVFGAGDAPNPVVAVLPNDGHADVVDGAAG